CSRAGMGEEYLLSGPHEHELSQWVGRAIELAVTVEHDSPRPGETHEGTKLTEVVINNFREATAPLAAIETPVAPPAVQEQPEQPPVAQEQPAQPPIGTSGTTERRLPRTASPIPFEGLMSLLSLTGALGLRRLRRD